jgi:hypothetical protein
LIIIKDDTSGIFSIGVGKNSTIGILFYYNVCTIGIFFFVLRFGLDVLVYAVGRSGGGVEGLVEPLVVFFIDILREVIGIGGVITSRVHTK